MNKSKKYILIIFIILFSSLLAYFSMFYINGYFIETLVVQKPVLINIVDIPSVLYKTGPHDEPPLEIKNLFEKIKKDNPEYTIKYFNDTQSRNFIKKNFDKKVLNAYDKLIPGAFKADLFRYCVLYQNGGVYGDLSQTYLVPLNKLVDRHHDNLVLVRDRFLSSFPFVAKHGVQISFMAAIPKLKIFMNTINQIVENVKNNYYGTNPLTITGPLLFRNILDKENTPFRLELEQTGIGGYIKNIITGESVIKTKLKNHDNLIKKNRKNSYHNAWYNKRVYKN